MSAEPPARAVVVIAAVALVLVTTGGLAGLSSMGRGAAPSSGGVPPVGAIWFGGVYHPDTHALSGCPRKVIIGCEIGVNSGEEVLLLAHFPRAVREAVDIRWGDPDDQPNTVPANGEFLAISVGPFPEPGYTVVVVTDSDGNVLALGGLTVWGP